MKIRIGSDWKKVRRLIRDLIERFTGVKLNFFLNSWGSNFKKNEMKNENYWCKITTKKKIWIGSGQNGQNRSRPEPGGGDPDRGRPGPVWMTSPYFLLGPNLIKIGPESRGPRHERVGPGPNLY